nr:hypothetical protein [Macromonas bipunctata]
MVIGQFGILQTGQIVQRLLVGSLQILATRFHLNEQLAGVKTVHAPAAAAGFFDPLLKIHQPLGRKAKHLAQIADEVLRLAHFVAGAGVVFGQGVGAVQNFGFVQGGGHGGGFCGNWRPPA